MNNQLSVKAVPFMSDELMQETFGIADSKYKATADQKKKIAAKKQEIFNKARAHKTIDEILDDPELQPYISPACTARITRLQSITAKMFGPLIR